MHHQDTFKPNLRLGDYVFLESIAKVIPKIEKTAKLKILIF